MIKVEAQSGQKIFIFNSGELLSAVEICEKLFGIKIRRLFSRRIL